MYIDTKIRVRACLRNEEVKPPETETGKWPIVHTEGRGF